MWQALGAIAVPLLGVIATLFKGTSRLSKRVDHHADLLAKLKGSGAAEVGMQGLLAEEVEWLAEREARRHSRKLNVGNLVLTLILFVGTTLAIYYTWTWVRRLSEDGPAWLYVISVLVLIIVALFLTVITAAAFTTLYTPSKSDAAKDAAKATAGGPTEAIDGTPGDSAT
jgi:magnesium-transporting ATPase (P-type)